MLERSYLAQHVKERPGVGRPGSPSSVEGGWPLADDPEASPRWKTLSPEIQGGVRAPYRHHVLLPLLDEHWTESPAAPKLSAALSSPGLPHSEPHFLPLGGSMFFTGLSLNPSFSAGGGRAYRKHLEGVSPKEVLTCQSLGLFTYKTGLGTPLSAVLRIGGNQVCVRVQ